MKSMFEKGWSASGTVCGWGSEIAHTENIRKQLPQIIKDYDIKTINDAGCGDLNWISTIDLSGIDYLGYDLVSRDTWNNKLKCQNLDIITECMRDSDMIICRDVFIHLPNDMVNKSIELFRKSSKYLLSTTFNGADNNSRMEAPNMKHSKISLEAAPFNLGQPLLCLNEDYENKLSCLWLLK